MTSVSPRLLEFQLRLLALNGVLEAARTPLQEVGMPHPGKVLGAIPATETFDIDTLQSLDFLLADGGWHQ